MRSIITKVVVAVLMIITAFAIALAYNAVAQRRLVSDLARINQGYVPVARHLDGVSEELRSFGRVLSNREPAALRQSLRASMALFPFEERVEFQLDELREHLDGVMEDELDADEGRFVQHLRSVCDALSNENHLIGRRVGDLMTGLDEDPHRLEPAYAEVGARLIALEKRIDDLRTAVDRRTDTAVERIKSAERDIMVRVIGASALACLFAVVMVIMIRRSLGPIRVLTELASQLKAGDYSARPVVAGNDEIGVLAREFEEMAEAIQTRDAEVRKKNAQLNEVNEALVEAQRAQVRAERLAAVGELSSRVTHELRNPLSSISMNVEMLSEELENITLPSDTREMVQSIEREVARLTELTDRYLSMARSDDPRKEPVDLCALVHSVVERQQAESDRVGISVSVEADGIKRASVDEAQIRQVLINLTRNAAQALRGARNPRILIGVARTGDRVSVSVEDSGPGIAPDMEETLFEPFTTDRADGTGLGLSISRRIARRHDGDLICGRSKRLGGARFELEVPA
ncbi:MAG: signal transduction histidine kinase [Bradymonadia bacterium]